MAMMMLECLFQDIPNRDDRDDADLHLSNAVISFMYMNPRISLTLHITPMMMYLFQRNMRRGHGYDDIGMPLSIYAK
jgi:hypothetical protein